MIDQRRIGMKKNTPGDEIRKLQKEIKLEIKNWEHINQNGCNDPFWPNGMNMNLTRNHIIYAKRKIAEICDEHGMMIPEEMYLPIPPEVDDYYMASLNQQQRLERIGCQEKITTKCNQYDKEQLSLF